MPPPDTAPADPWGRTVEAVIFDKDGTLLDFHATWDRAIGVILTELADGRTDLLAAAAAVVAYDLATQRVLPHSPIIAESNAHIIALLRPTFGLGDGGDLAARYEGLVARVAATTAREAVGATALLAALAQRGIPLGIATNDSEGVARAQVDELGWSDAFGAIVGYDSGYGAKPAPGMIIGCAARLGIDPQRCVMVGDSAHDMIAAAAAGALPVLIGRPEQDPGQIDLRSITSLGELPALLELRSL